MRSYTTFLAKTKHAMAKTIPEKTSTTKCCLRVTVDIEIKRAHDRYTGLIHLFFFAYADIPAKNANNQEKVTWADGKVLLAPSTVLVSSTIRPDKLASV